MPRLVLIRHAKAGDAATDVARPLSPRGRRDAAALGRWLRAASVTPDRVVVSPATRARETWELAAGEAGDTTTATVDERIYANAPELLLRIVRATPNDVRTLVLVGHNPAIETLAAALDDGAGDESARATLAGGFPTNGIAVFDLIVPWAAAEDRTGTVAAAAAPRAGDGD